jgi:hypothetical protein
VFDDITGKQCLRADMLEIATPISFSNRKTDTDEGPWKNQYHNQLNSSGPQNYFTSYISELYTKEPNRRKKLLTKTEFFVIIVRVLMFCDYC